MILASEFRIKDKERIEEVKSNGELLQSENFGIRYLKREAGEINSRFAFVISTKISKLAVHRNRINRSLHEGIRRVISKIPKSLDFVFLAKKGISTKSTEEIIREVGLFFDKFV